MNTDKLPRGGGLLYEQETIENFSNLMQALYDTRNNIFDNEYEQEKISRFQTLCKDKKLIFFGCGYYAKIMPKYIKLNYGVKTYGVYDWVSEEIDEDDIFCKSMDLKYLDMKKYNKYKDKVHMLLKKEFYSDPENTVIFINFDIYPYTPKILYRAGFKHIYTMRNLAKNTISAEMLQKHSTGFEEYDTNKLNYSFSILDVANIITLFNLLDDEKSKNVFMSILKFKLTEDYFYTMNIKDDVTLQYLDEDVISFHDNEVFLDCGGFIGDTIEAFIKRVNGKFKHIYSYEPELGNFNQLKKSVEVYEQKDKITPIQAGISYKNKTLYLQGDSEGTSFTNKTTNKKAQVVTIDDTIKHPPTFIKMDVQLFEIQALLGGIKSILKHKPKLAISIYHKFDDLWNIPLLLKHWLPEYKLVMRHYECTQEETIIYLLPK